MKWTLLALCTLLACRPLEPYVEADPALEARVSRLEHEHMRGAPDADRAPTPAPEEGDLWYYLAVALLSAVTGRYGDRAAKAGWKKMKEVS